MSLMGLRWEMDTLITPIISIGDWYRVAGCCWSPAGNDTSLILEVGLSESSEELANIAKGWLETPGSTVQMVVTIDINRDEARVRITLWELGTTMAQSPSTRRAAAIEISRLNGETVVVGEQYPDSCHNRFDNGESFPTTELVLPFEKIVGRSPEEWFEKDFRIYKVELEHLAELVWQKQGFIPK